MAGKIKTQRQLFFGELLRLAPARHFAILRTVFGLGAAVKNVEQAGLHGVALGLLGGFHGDADRGHQTRPVVVERIECPGADQRFDGAPVDHALVNAQAEIKQILERPALIARPDQRIDRLLSRALDRPQTVADGAAVDRHEAVLRGIDVRAEQLEPVFQRVVVENLHRVSVVHV